MKTPKKIKTGYSIVFDQVCKELAEVEVVLVQTTNAEWKPSYQTIVVRSIPLTLQILEKTDQSKI